MCPAAGHSGNGASLLHEPVFFSQHGEEFEDNPGDESQVWQHSQRSGMRGFMPGAGGDEAGSDMVYGEPRS